MGIKEEFFPFVYSKITQFKLHAKRSLILSFIKYFKMILLWMAWFSFIENQDLEATVLQKFFSCVFKSFSSITTTPLFGVSPGFLLFGAAGLCAVPAEGKVCISSVGWCKELLGKRTSVTHTVGLFETTEEMVCVERLAVWPGDKGFSVQSWNEGCSFLSEVRTRNTSHSAGICQRESSVLVLTVCGSSERPVSKQEDRKLERNKIGTMAEHILWVKHYLQWLTSLDIKSGFLQKTV